MSYRILIALGKDKNSKNVPLFSLNGEKIKEITLPIVFNYPVRNDLIRRAFHSAHTARLQPKGRDPLAGKRRVGESWGINHSVARVPRLDNGRAVFAPMVRGGRLAHPPRVEKRIHEEINRKERIRALASSLAATSIPELVRKRGHVFSADRLPIVTVDDIEEIDKASDARKVLENLGLWKDVERAHKRIRIRTGKGKMRGRRYIVPKSVLIVTSSENSKALWAFRNLPGVDVISVNSLSVIHLAPGGVPGRLTLFTETSLAKIAQKFEVIML